MITYESDNPEAFQTYSLYWNGILGQYFSVYEHGDSELQFDPNKCPYWLDPEFATPDGVAENLRRPEPPDDLLAKQILSAEECQGVFECRVCQESYPINNPCRHIQYSEYETQGEIGCGSDMRAEDHKDGFWAVLHYFDIYDIASLLREALVNHAYQIELLYEGEKLDSISIQLFGAEYGEDVSTELEELMQGEFSTGILWLASLEPGVTSEAEAITIEWIDQWLARPDT